MTGRPNAGATVHPLGKALQARPPGLEIAGRRPLHQDAAVIPLAFQLEFLAELAMSLCPDRVVADLSLNEVLAPALSNEDTLIGELRQTDGSFFQGALKATAEEGSRQTLMLAARLSLSHTYVPVPRERSLLAPELKRRRVAQVSARAKEALRTRLGPLVDRAWHRGLGLLSASLELGTTVAKSLEASRLCTSPHVVDALLRLCTAAWYTYSGEESRVSAVEHLAWHRLPRLPEPLHAEARLRGARGEHPLVDVSVHDAEGWQVLTLSGVQLTRMETPAVSRVTQEAWQAWMAAVTLTVRPGAGS